MFVVLVCLTLFQVCGLSVSVYFFPQLDCVVVYMSGGDDDKVGVTIWLLLFVCCTTCAKSYASQHAFVKGTGAGQ